MRARLNGPFRLHDEGGRDITPIGMKERGLLALLLTSPGQRRTRIWLQALLWSDRESHQASGSLRQALSNVRKALGSCGNRLKADRSTLWFEPEVPLDDVAQGEFLSDLDIRDPAFSDWLRDRRAAEDDAPPARLSGPRTFGDTMADRWVRPLVMLRWTDLGVTPRGRFLTHAVAQRIAGDLILFGNIDVIQSDADLDRTMPPNVNALVEMECFGDGGQNQLLIRVIGLPARRIAWTGRLSLDLSVPEVWDSAEASRCVNKTVTSVVELLASAPVPGGNPGSLSRAVKLIYSFDRPSLVQADDMLVRVQDTELRGLALAWRGFIRLTSALEFRDHGPDGVAEARAFADDALRAMADHPVVLALASRISLKLDGDLDHAHYLALRAAELSDQNPYALEALGQSLIFHGDYVTANQMAQSARNAAQGLPNGFNWDMQACLTLLGLGQFGPAREAAADCHRKMPFYRPAIRYLVALSLLQEDRTEADYYADRLRRLEPDFQLSSLIQPTYPIETLRVLGHVETLRRRLG
jgi:hypothetical protein